MKLYYSPGSCSMAAHIALREIGAEFELERVLLAERANFKPEFLKVNPKARVPVLRDGDFILTELTAILHYIVTFKNGGGLLPQDQYEAARAYEWSLWLASTFHITYAQLWRPERFYPEADQHHAAFVNEATPMIRQHNSKIEEHLSARPFVAGASYSFADPYLLVFYRWGNKIGLDMSDYPAFTEWTGRILQRPAVAEAMRAEGVGIDGT